MLDKIAPTATDRVARLVEQVLEGKGKPGLIGADDRLVDAGLTSVDMVNLMLGVEAEFDIMIPAADITPGNFRSIATIEAMVGRVRALAG